MKNIVFMTFMLISFVYADTVGIAQKMWTSVPKDIYNETEPLVSVTDSSNRQVSSWSPAVVTRQPVVVNQTRTLDDIKVLTTTTTQVTTPIIPKTLTSSEKNWIATVDEGLSQSSANLPLAQTIPVENTTVTSTKEATNDTGWIEASQNYNETAFSKPEKKLEEVTTIQEPVIMASPVKQPKEEIIVTAEATPSITSEVSSQIEPQLEITEEIIKIPEDSGSADILESPFDMQKYFQDFSAFIAPLTSFVKENAILSGSFLSVLGLFFYLLFYRPLSSKVHNRLDDEIEVPQARMQPQPQYYQEQEAQNSSFAQEQNPMLNTSIITQSEYSTLYGLMNETFIFEKERILLSNDITQERKNREIISLEWKFNQILHFSLPKLSTDNPKLFVEGVKELLDEEVSKDIMIIALKDILEKNTLSNLQKEDLAKHIERVTPKKAPKDTLRHDEAHKRELNYSSYMSS